MKYLYDDHAYLCFLFSKLGRSRRYSEAPEDVAIPRNQVAPDNYGYQQGSDEEVHPHPQRQVPKWAQGQPNEFQPPQPQPYAVPQMEDGRVVQLKRSPHPAHKVAYVDDGVAQSRHISPGNAIHPNAPNLMPSPGQHPAYKNSPQAMQQNYLHPPPHQGFAPGMSPMNPLSPHSLPPTQIQPPAPPPHPQALFEPPHPPPMPAFGPSQLPYGPGFGAPPSQNQLPPPPNYPSHPSYGRPGMPDEYMKPTPQQQNFILPPGQQMPYQNYPPSRAGRPPPSRSGVPISDPIPIEEPEPNDRLSTIDSERRASKSRNGSRASSKKVAFANQVLPSKSSGYETPPSQRHKSRNKDDSGTKESDSEEIHSRRKNHSSRKEKRYIDYKEPSSGGKRRSSLSSEDSSQSRRSRQRRKKQRTPPSKGRPATRGEPSAGRKKDDHQETVENLQQSIRNLTPGSAEREKEKKKNKNRDSNKKNDPPSVNKENSFWSFAKKLGKNVSKLANKSEQSATETEKVDPDEVSQREIIERRKDKSRSKKSSSESKRREREATIYQDYGHEQQPTIVISRDPRKTVPATPRELEGKNLESKSSAEGDYSASPDQAKLRRAIPVSTSKRLTNIAPTTSSNDEQRMVEVTSSKSERKRTPKKSQPSYQRSSTSMYVKDGKPVLSMQGVKTTPVQSNESAQESGVDRSNSKNEIEVVQTKASEVNAQVSPSKTVTSTMQQPHLQSANVPQIQTPIIQQPQVLIQPTVQGIQQHLAAGVLPQQVPQQIIQPQTIAQAQIMQQPSQVVTQPLVQQAVVQGLQQPQLNNIQQAQIVQQAQIQAQQLPVTAIQQPIVAASQPQIPIPQVQAVLQQNQLPIQQQPQIAAPQPQIPIAQQAVPQAAQVIQATVSQAAVPIVTQPALSTAPNQVPAVIVQPTTQQPADVATAIMQNIVKQANQFLSEQSASSGNEAPKKAPSKPVIIYCSR